TTFQRRDIRRMDEIKSVAEQYAERRAQINDDDLDARYALIIWVYEQRDCDLARRELQAYAQDAPQDNRVNTLRQAIEQQMRAADRTTTQPRVEPEQPVAPAEGEAAVVEVKDGELLTKEQMNLIKVYEVDLGERPPVHIPPEIIERFF